jgi:glutathione synthase/RimK-type ligase-like ATP-grasp enzyme
MSTKETHGSPIRVAVIFGADARKTLPAHDARAEGYPGTNDFHRFIKVLRETHLVDLKLLAITPGYFRQDRRWDLNNFDVGYISISDPDQNPKVLKVAERILRGDRISVINHPRHTQQITRSNVTAMLANMPDIVMPKTLQLPSPLSHIAFDRIGKEGMRFPIILRSVGSHTGQTMRLCKDESALASALAGAKGPHYLTEFHDFQSSDGLYRKHRFLRVGRAIIHRHLIVSDNWCVHSDDILRFMNKHPKLIAEERTVYQEGIDRRFPGATEIIRRITERTKLEYVGLDCSFLDDRRLLVFELNSTMSFFPWKPESSVFGNIDQIRMSAIVAALRQLLEDKTGRPVLPRADSFGVSTLLARSLAALDKQTDG